MFAASPAAIRNSLLTGVILILSGLAPQTVRAQSGLRESLEKLDQNKNGQLDPDEITALSRPFLERVAEVRRMSLGRSYTIGYWQEAARIYHAKQNGAFGERIRPVAQGTVQPFKPQSDQVLVPEFGLPEMKYAYTQSDLNRADATIRRSDRDGDGLINKREAERATWTYRNPFEMDLDGDNHLSRLELAQRYARRRMLTDDSKQIRDKERANYRSSYPSTRSSNYRSTSYNRYDPQNYLTMTLMGRFDANRNGRLEVSETDEIGIPVSFIDTDNNLEISTEELRAYFGKVEEESGGELENVPPWFFELDRNRDDQIAMSEFTDQWTQEKLEEFAEYDVNGDGLLTQSEVAQAKALVGGKFTSGEAKMLSPRKTITAEIDVEDSFLAGDVNVQLSITHTYASYLDAFLISPDGTRIELFTAVGGSDDHFNGTILDDEARYPIIKARPPFQGSFITEGKSKNQPGLSAFNGKSIQGVWKLEVHNQRSDRFGMLHEWSLMFKPQQLNLDDAEDGEQTSSESKPSPK